MPNPTKIIYVFNSLKKKYNQDCIDYFGNSCFCESAFHDGLVLTDLAELWAFELNNYTDEQIKEGVRQTRNKKDFPTLEEFKAGCLVEPVVQVYESIPDSEEITNKRKSQYINGIKECRNILKS